MGSLTSRPKVPQRQEPQIVYVPAPQPLPQPGAGVLPPSKPQPSNTEDTAQENRKNETEKRERSLLSRDRSRFGTVQTSFRGLLSLANGNGGQKTLLGE